MNLPYTFTAGTKAKAQEVNENFVAVADELDNLSNIVSSGITNLQQSLVDQISNINADITEMNTKITNLQTTLNNKGYTQKAKTIGIGTTQMSSYLPQDGQQYLVWFEAARGAKNSDSLFVASNKQTTARKVFQLDGDSGRSSYATAYGIVPTTSNGSITFSGSTDYIYLLGYCRI